MEIHEENGSLPFSVHLITILLHTLNLHIATSNTSVDDVVMFQHVNMLHHTLAR